VSLLPLPLRLLLPRQAIPHRRQAITDPLPFQRDVFGFDDLFSQWGEALVDRASPLIFSSRLISENHHASSGFPL
jgi:hypothetical protein